MTVKTELYGGSDDRAVWSCDCKFYSRSLEEHISRLFVGSGTVGVIDVEGISESLTVFQDLLVVLVRLLLWLFEHSV